MNDVKKELIKMTGDMSKNKDRVKQRLVQHRKVKLKMSIRLKVLTAIVTLCLVGFVIQFLDSDKKQSAQLFNQTQLAYYEDILKIISYDKNRESYRREAYEKYEKRVAIYYFAQSFGIESTKEEQMAEGEKRIEEIQMLQELPEYAVLFKNLGLKGYYTKYIEPMLPMLVAEKKLEAMYLEKYPTFPNGVIGDLVARDARNYFNIHFSEQAKAFQEEIGLENYTNVHRGITLIGTVVAIQDNAFLHVEGAVPADVAGLSQAQIIEKYQNATWYPLIDDISLQIGNYVAVQSLGGVTTDEDVPVNRFGIVDAIEIIDPTVTKNITIDNDDEVRAFLNPVNWRMKEKTFDTAPNYAFELDGVRVDIWEGYGHSLWLQAQEYGEIQLSQERAKQLKALLKMEES